jgi:L-alanine-DL-glutamate epimerase-like enolase superfamily enzyme
MRIVKIEDLHADGGWRVFSFLKVTTDEGLVGWSEFSETSWNRGLAGVIRKLAATVIGEDPRAYARIAARLVAVTRMAPGGINQQAIGAIENACIDIAAKAANVPVHALFGGPMRDRVPLYWSHCGSFRVRNAAYFERVLKTPPVRSLDDFRRIGAEARARGFAAVKTNPVVFEAKGPRMLNSGFGADGLDLGHNATNRIVDAIAAQLAAFRDGLGPEAGLMIDVNFAFRPEGLRRIAKAAEPFRLAWLEMDVHDPAALAALRRATATPVASLETLYGRRAYRPYFEAEAVDVAVVDVPWNGFAESVRIAALAEAHEVNVAPHNFTGPLANLMSAQFCAAVPNLRIMEFEGDDVPWKDSLLTAPPRIEAGEMLVPAGPGWGADIDEAAVAEHKPPGGAP